ncbi:hypothetical protein [Evtepia sp.]|uniref:hypothetical protein n=1 Tax=Evtepia sp. TaxID=2773933 RepID=UPI002A8230FC|nr:hypothetical protein [Evtepia sp.]MDY4430452.1 hypothetical protein [Evtepia sp.]
MRIIVDDVGIDRITLVNSHGVVIPSKAAYCIISPCRAVVCVVGLSAGFRFNLPDLIAFQTSKVQRTNAAARRPIAISDRSGGKIGRSSGGRVCRTVLIDNLNRNCAGTAWLKIVAGSTTVALFAPVSSGNPQFIGNGQNLKVIGNKLMVACDGYPRIVFGVDFPVSVPIAHLGKFYAIVRLIIARVLCLLFRATRAAVCFGRIQQSAAPVLKGTAFFGGVYRQERGNIHAFLRIGRSSRYAVRVTTIRVCRTTVGNPIFDGKRGDRPGIRKSASDGHVGEVGTVATK